MQIAFSGGGWDVPCRDEVEHQLEFACRDDYPVVHGASLWHWMCVCVFPPSLLYQRRLVFIKHGTMRRREGNTGKKKRQQPLKMRAAKTESEFISRRKSGVCSEIHHSDLKHEVCCLPRGSPVWSAFSGERGVEGTSKANSLRVSGFCHITYSICCKALKRPFMCCGC